MARIRRHRRRLATLDAQGVEPVEAFDIHLTLINYLRGAAAVLEPERDTEAAGGLDNDAWLAEQEPGLAALVGSGRFPMLQRMVSTEYALDVDALLERGLLLLLDGLAVQFDRIADASRTAAPPWAR